ncbi:hypothetical protein M413DRAFT_441453 [Hebeloma cylindrosporum]|uniref:N-acetyltransferase domain-containing protein n=1 Tax=Hebeloma cylindrosporum TaxID=76867 RepID=A0A0C3CR35_HEBCY|nr:hypothetical protein M413DRAFT_441453 [Hebeloma cylindrosporum h7]
MEKLISEILGDRIKDMIYVNLLATQPQSQGHGYGGALLDIVTRLADAQGRAAYLSSSNVLNAGFYNSHGFKTVGEVYLGDDNPEWHQEPIILRLVSSIRR